MIVKWIKNLLTCGHINISLCVDSAVIHAHADCPHLLFQNTFFYFPYPWYLAACSHEKYADVTKMCSDCREERRISNFTKKKWYF